MSAAIDGAASGDGPPHHEAGQAEALRRFEAGEVRLVGVETAGDCIPGLSGRTLSHAGPPIEWGRMCPPLRGALLGAAVLEGWAGGLEDAARLLEGGGVRLVPNHHLGAVNPMAGVISPSMPVWVVQNVTFGNRAYTGLSEGVGAVLRYGANGPAVLNRLRWMATTVAPLLRRVVADTTAPVPLDLGALMGRALAMGDELHQRHAAASALFLRALLPALLGGGAPAPVAREVGAFLAGNDQLFLNLSMATAKALLDPLRGIPGCSLVVAMSRNGTDFGIQVSGTADRWFTAPSNLPAGRYLPGFGAADANPDLGDSAITETAGLGGFALAAAPATVEQLGVESVARTVAWSREMRALTAGESTRWRLPALEFAGTGAGIDVRRVVRLSVEPLITTGIAHRRAGIGQVGVGLVRAPLACFRQALEALEALGGCLPAPGGAVRTGASR